MLRRHSRQQIVVDGDALVSTIKDLFREADVKGIVHEGNIRRVIIKDEEGKTLIELSLAWGRHRRHCGPHAGRRRSDRGVGGQSHY